MYVCKKKKSINKHIKDNGLTKLILCDSQAFFFSSLLKTTFILPPAPIWVGIPLIIYLGERLTRSWRPNTQVRLLFVGPPHTHTLACPTLTIPAVSTISVAKWTLRNRIVL